MMLFVGPLWAQAPANPPPANDNPTADLDLSDGNSPPPLTGFADIAARHLMILDDGRLKTFDTSALQGVKYWAFYYSASWCPPCRVFTPKLVDFYHAFKPKHPDFELIFVNMDQTEEAMVGYMKADKMPWPAVDFDAIDRYGPKKYCGPAIPDLVLVGQDGQVLSDSFNGSMYRGPFAVLEDIKHLVH